MAVQLVSKMGGIATGPQRACGRRTEWHKTCALVLVCLAHRLDGRGLRHASRKDLR